MRCSALQYAEMCRSVRAFAAAAGCVPPDVVWWECSAACGMGVPPSCREAPLGGCRIRAPCTLHSAGLIPAKPGQQQPQGLLQWPWGLEGAHHKTRRGVSMAEVQLLEKLLVAFCVQTVLVLLEALQGNGRSSAKVGSSVRWHFRLKAPNCVQSTRAFRPWTVNAFWWCGLSGRLFIEIRSASVLTGLAGTLCCRWHASARSRDAQERSGDALGTVQGHPGDPPGTPQGRSGGRSGDTLRMHRACSGDAVGTLWGPGHCLVTYWGGGGGEMGPPRMLADPPSHPQTHPPTCRIP